VLIEGAILTRLALHLAGGVPYNSGDKANVKASHDASREHGEKSFHGSGSLRHTVARIGAERLAIDTIGVHAARRGFDGGNNSRRASDKPKGVKGNPAKAMAERGKVDCVHGSVPQKSGGGRIAAP
jgi:hypothetical protein